VFISFISIVVVLPFALPPQRTAVPSTVKTTRKPNRFRSTTTSMRVAQPTPELTWTAKVEDSLDLNEDTDITIYNNVSTHLPTSQLGKSYIGSYLILQKLCLVYHYTII